MSTKYGPTRSELKFRLWASVLGLLMLIGALAYRGFPGGPAMFEVVVIAGAFFSGSFVWSLRKLKQMDHPDDNL